MPTPATTVMKVRTMGTKRARMIARAPYRSKKACARSTFFWLNNRDSGLVKIDGPARRPIS